jgi:hypothetical protein
VRAVETLVAERAQLAKKWAESSLRTSEEGAALAQELEAMRHTISWRATLPLRRLRKTGAGGAVRGMLRVLWRGARRGFKPS